MAVLQLITVVAESVLRDHLVKDFTKLGARGFTITHAEGEGTRGIRSSVLDDNIRIEAVVSDEVSEKIFTHLKENYFPHYACIAWTHPVTVLRGDHYI